MVTQAARQDLRLLPLLNAVGGVEPLTALIGMGSVGRPVLLNLNRSQTWHVLVEGPAGIGKSEFLRSLLVSLALTTRRSQMQTLGIDIGGKELAVMEGLPHSLTDLATDVRFACQILRWTAEETQRRASQRLTRPAVMLLIDDITWLENDRCGAAIRDLTTIVEHGVPAGVHLLAARRTPANVSLTKLLHRPGMLRASTHGRRVGTEGRSGRFTLAGRDGSVEVQVAWLSTRDLRVAVRLARSGWRCRGVSVLRSAMEVGR